MSQILWGPGLMPKTYNNQQQRASVFKRLYWNAQQNRVMWQYVQDYGKKPVILFSIPKATGTSYHRIQQPIRVLINKYPNDYIFIYAQYATVADCMKRDIVQLHRARPMHDAILNFFRNLPQNIKKPVFVNNIDDLEYEIPKTHYLYNQWIKSGKDKMSIRMFKQSDYNLITSWNYQKTIQRDIGINVIKGKTYRFPNWIDYELPQWTRTSKKSDKINLGWIGLVSHNVDLVYIHNIWKPLSQKYKNKIKFTICSPNPDQLEYRDQNFMLLFTRKKNNGQKQYGFTQYVKGLFKDITQSEIELVDALPLSQYGKLYSNLDLSFAVVQPTKFNRAKSEIKLTQSVLYGRLPIYNNFGPYSEWDQKFRNYLKQNFIGQQLNNYRRMLNLCSYNIHDVKVVGSWVKGLSQIIDNWNNVQFKQLKEKFVNQMYKFNIKEYGMNQNIDKRKKFYDMIVKDRNISKEQIR